MPNSLPRSELSVAEKGFEEVRRLITAVRQKKCNAVRGLLAGRIFCRYLSGFLREVQDRTAHVYFSNSIAALMTCAQRRPRDDMQGGEWGMPPPVRAIRCAW